MSIKAWNVCSISYQIFHFYLKMRRKIFFPFMLGAIKMTINIFRDRFEFIAFCVIEIQMKNDEPQGCYLNMEWKSAGCCGSALYIQYWVSLFSHLYPFVYELWGFFSAPNKSMKIRNHICGWIAQGINIFVPIFYVKLAYILSWFIYWRFKGNLSNWKILFYLCFIFMMIYENGD